MKSQSLPVNILALLDKDCFVMRRNKKLVQGSYQNEVPYNC